MLSPQICCLSNNDEALWLICSHITSSQSKNQLHTFTSFFLNILNHWQFFSIPNHQPWILNPTLRAASKFDFEHMQSRQVGMDEPGQKSSPGLACICWRCFFSTFINLLWGLYIFQLRFNPMFILKLKAVYGLNPIWKMKVNLRCSLRHQTSFHVTNVHTFSERLTDTMAGSSPNTLPMQTREDVTF